MSDGIPAPNRNYECPIQNVVGNSNTKIQNKNLFDVDEFIAEARDKGYTTSQVSKTTYLDKEVLKYQNSLPNLRFMQGKFKENTRYTLKTGVLKTGYNGGNAPYISIVYTDGTYQTLYVDYSSTSFIAVTTTSTNNKTIDYIKVPDYALGQIVYLDLSVTQLEIGTTATDYVKHQEQNYPFTFAEGQRVMQGTTLEDDGIHNKREQYVFTGNEEFGKSSSYGGNYWVPLNKLNKKFKANTPFLCNYAKSVTSLTNFRVGTCYCDSTINLWLGDENQFPTVESFKNYLVEQYTNGTPIIIEGVLAEEEIIPYNATQQAQYNAKKQAQSYDDQTNISQTNEDLPFILNIETLKK